MNNIEKQINILVVITDGTEDIEATVPIDLFRRANFNVTVASDKEIVTYARETKVIPDTLLDKIPEDATFDLIFIPGGAKGVERLLENEKVGRILSRHKSQGKVIAAICAGPLVLDKFGILSEVDKVTSHPSVKDKLAKYNYVEEEVVMSGKIITSRGAGTSIPFALKIIETLANPSLAEKIAKNIVYKK
jgi:4-methyl-5(b-hydroxyethyl)-thiazole monophosphate biosynthesis